MGKPKPKDLDKSKKMADVVTERRKNVTLKRSKSVRASLRFISTKLLNKNINNNNITHTKDLLKLNKTPSMSSLQDYQKSDHTEGFIESFYPRNQPVETILKTPMIKVDNKSNSRAFKRTEKLNKNRRDQLDGHLKLSTPPSLVAPKAAQLLQIPSIANKQFSSMENLDQKVIRRWVRNEKYSHHGKTGDRGEDYWSSGFQRGALRLSITTKRKNGARNSSLSEDDNRKLPTLSGDLDMEVASIPLTRGLPPPSHKPSKKEAKLLQQKLEKLARINIHLHALFSAVECGHLEKARTILESTDADINSVNSDLLSPLDIAVLSNNRPMAKMLVSFGGREGSQFSSSEKMGSHLRQLLCEAEMRLQELGGLLEEPCGAALNTRCAGGDTEKQAVAWGRKAKTLKRLVLGFTQARPPDVPSMVALDITAKNAITVRLAEPTSQESPITTKFLVQWSTRPDFSIISGTEELTDMSNLRCQVELTQGRRYYFRASCGNLKGYGMYRASTPASVTPSTWREIEQKDPRYGESNNQLDQLIEEVRQLRPGSEMLESAGPSQRRAQRKKTTIKQLFTAASKFQKNLKRGIYLACILYHEDKVLVTNEDFLPVIEIDESFPSCINNDLYWLMRVASTWDDTKCLKTVMEEHTSSTIHFRTKLLLAALQMQSSLCLQDLGQLYYRPVRDSQGTVVVSTINYVKSPKSVSVLNSRWLPMNKVFKKAVLSDDSSIGDVLMASIQDQINYHQVSGLKLGRGLYLAYLKMQSSVDMIQLVVSTKTPNMLPHCKVRDNPHVSAEEWEYLKQQHLPDVVDNASELQRNFLELMTSAAKRLFNYMDIPSDEANTHRLYDTEVIELTGEISFIAICPSAEFSCAVPGQREILLQRGDLISLPIQVFEMIHLNTYQSNIVQKYCKLSCLLELDSATASHLHREAFSNTEVAVARERLARLQDLQNKLESIWKSVRWLADVITFARDRTVGSIVMRHILEKEIGVSTSPKRDLLQIPPPKVIKTTPGRGSWPGPGGTTQNVSASLVSEHSKSEQHLNINGSSSHYLSARSDPECRKNSESFTSASDYLSQLTPSRSEDVLFSVPSCSNVPNSRPRNVAVSSMSVTTSPLLSVKPMYGGSMVSVNTINTTDSLHSLSSDSDQQPLSSSTPQKKKPRPRMVPSKSMANVKQNFLEPTSSDQNVMFLTVDHAFPGLSNLDSNLSKSLTNIGSTLSDMDRLDPYLPELDSPNCPVVFPEIFNLPSDDPEPYAKDNYDILQIYAAYETGLVIGTSLKVYVTPRTTAREVVNVVVRQLNMAVILKGKKGPIYNRDMLKNFCLVAIIGARERCLRDDFKPLLLQNPWKLGRLYVRRKHDVLAALDHSSKLDRIESNRIDRI
ncbi:uncharacterized protein LOC115881170 isoform X2 [Sitophilus oryzae]|uniref:Uncharacterized protein LOC115881170 isoform X2 n=1 Tax=Sitophilus oryzae TaxID=7048 RepID=A0A6J2XSC8_SITOR|nr:uncharacterized protein LOC115881170 isoform X2 [Sitophilus oryzae]